jgi:osmoprotectant transport system permease protein
MTWFVDNLPHIATLLGAHIATTVPAIALSVLIAVTIGRIAQSSGRARSSILAVSGVLYALPSLPLLIVIPLAVGVPLRSPATMILALTVYGVALLTRTAADAFASVPDEVVASAVASGYTPMKRMLQIELPLAAPVLVAGTRVVAMSTIGLATIGALVGIPSLGSLLTDGFQRGIAAEITAGIVLTLALAALVDAGLRGIGVAVQPWQRVEGLRRSVAA